MAPLKFEDKMKEKLEQRAIQPSESSWERLSTQLDNQKSQKNQNKKIWYSVAAIFIGVLITTSIIKNNNSASKPINTQFVDENKEDIDKENIRIVQDEDVKQIEESNPIVSIDNKIKPSSKEKYKNLEKENISRIVTSKDKAEKSNFDNDKDTELVENDINRASVKHQILPIDSLIIEDKVAGVVAQIQELQKNDIPVTDKEINELLLKAQREIASEKILKSTTVSASALLQDIENELDETFKQRVFEALKTGFQKVKTAVAEREN